MHTDVTLKIMHLTNAVEMLILLGHSSMARKENKLSMVVCSMEASDSILPDQLSFVSVMGT